MSDLDKQTQTTDSPIIRSWQRIPVLIRAIVSGAIVEAIGVGVWVLSLAVIPAPWSVVVMGGILWYIGSTLAEVGGQGLRQMQEAKISVW